jgi:ferrous iron transport protein B
MQRERKIVLVGNPNVGKSVIFSHLTGARVVISNYPGTTVEYTRGRLQAGNRTWEVLDAPGTYSLEPTCRAEEVASSLVDEADVVINVVDATHLERNLYLTSQLLERKVPMIVALNLIDEAEQKGIKINVALLQELLGVPVIPTVAISGKGLAELVEALPRARRGAVETHSAEERWAWIGSIIKRAQRVTRRRQTWLEALEMASIRPLTGVPIAAAVLYLAFKIVIEFGEILQDLLVTYFFEPVYLPLLEKLSRLLGGGGFWHDLLIGQYIDGAIQLEESMGLFSTGVFVVFGILTPFLLLFYLVLGFLEDCGYLPRLAVMSDRLMHRLGLHGFAIIPTLLGFGCNVPAVLAVRNLESRRERLIASTMLVVAIPCAAQMSLIIALAGRYGGGYLGVILAMLFLIWVATGLVLDRVLPGYTPSMIVEIPPYRWPGFKAQLQKVGLRLEHFFTEAIPYIFGGILLVNLLHFTGIIEFLSAAFAPIFQGLLGLPREAVSTILVGFLRKDVAVALLLPLDLTARQFVIGCIVLATYFPCVAAFTVMIKELGLRDMAIATGMMILISTAAGTALNLLLDRVLPAPYLALLLAGLAITLIAFCGGSSDRRESRKIFTKSTKERRI